MTTVQLYGKEHLGYCRYGAASILVLWNNYHFCFFFYKRKHLRPSKVMGHDQIYMTTSLEEPGFKPDSWSIHYEHCHFSQQWWLPQRLWFLLPTHSLSGRWGSFLTPWSRVLLYPDSLLALKAFAIRCTTNDLSSTWILRGLLGGRKKDYVVTEAGKRGIISLYGKGCHRHKPLTGFQVSCSFQDEVWKGSCNREICPRIISCGRDSNPGYRDICHVWGWLFFLLSVRSTFVGIWIKFRGVTVYHFI